MGRCKQEADGPASATSGSLGCCRRREEGGASNVQTLEAFLHFSQGSESLTTQRVFRILHKSHGR